jgi:hypothetical protein
MRRLFIKHLSLALIVVTVMGSSQLLAQDTRVVGWLHGARNRFAGTAYPIGRFRGKSDPKTATAEWTTRRGSLSSQTTRFELVFPIFRNLYYYEQSVEFTGGTRRFNNVTGNAKIIGLINVRSRRHFGFIDGKLTKNRPPSPPPEDPPSGNPPPGNPPS